MGRILLVILLNVAATMALIAIVGGVRGPGAERPDPQVEEVATLPTSSERIVPPGQLPLAIHGARGVWLPTDPEPVQVTDPTTGESVLVPDFERYTFEAAESRPVEADTANRQAAQALDVRVHVYREPRTLEEARALLNGEPGAQERLLKWRIRAPLAEAEFLQEGLSITQRRRQASAAEALIVLSNGVQIEDAEEGLVVEGEELELEPGQGAARGHGVFTVRHPAFELTGEDLELTRDESVERIHIRRNAFVRIVQELKDQDGRALLDLGGDAFKPGFVRAEGGAKIVREMAFGRERLQIVLTGRVHAQQEGGRRLDAERVTVVAWRPATSQAQEDWKLQRFDADGGARVEYPGVSGDGSPVLVSLQAERLIHELADDGTATTLLEGHPRVDLRGDVPLQGIGGDRRLGLLHASAASQAWLTLPGPGEVPAGADPAQYLRLVLQGEARLERRDAGVDRDWDRLEGDHLTMLLKRTPGARESSAPQDRLVACSFALLGNVHLGGSRMSGTTHRLIGEHLDTHAPVLVAEGPETAFEFHGLRPGERLLGGNRHDARGGSRGTAGSTGPASAEEAWVLERVRATGNLVVRTSLGGPTIGLPAQLEGAELAYDRVSDRARLQGGATTLARLAVGDPSQPRHTITSRSMLFERARGVIRAQGSVRGSVYVVSDAEAPTAFDSLGLGDQDVGAPATFRVSTGGRIEIRGLLAESPRTPRLNADQVIRIEGDVIAELHSSVAADKLRAQTVEVALRRVRREEAVNTMSAPLARAADTRRPRTASPHAGPPAAKGKRVRWDVEAEVLAARVADEGLIGVEAVGGAVLRSEDGEIRGRRIAYDTRIREAVAQGSNELQAQAIFGPVEARNEVWAPAMTLRLGTHGAERLQASAPAWAVLIRTEDTASEPRWERFEARCDAPIVITTDGLRSDGLVEILRNTRSSPGAAWEAPARLWADRLLVEGDGLLARGGGEVRRVIASGPRTHFQMGEGSSQTRVWGEQFDLDVHSSLATLTGGDVQQLRIERGPPGRSTADSLQRRIVLDLKTGMIRNLDQMQLILRGGAER